MSENQYGSSEVDRRAGDNRPSVVTPRMHYDLVRRVDGLEKRIASSEMVVHEISHSNDLLRSQITTWLVDVLKDFDTITKAIEGLRVYQTRVLIVICIGFVFLMVGLPIFIYLIIR